MDFYQTQQTVDKILEGHRKGYSDIQQTANLLEIFWGKQTEDTRNDMVAIMWNALATEPLQPLPPAGNISPNIQRVLIRSIATFGPTAELPARVFGRLTWNDAPASMEFWAQHLCNELSYSMLHKANRLAQATLDQAKAYCVTYTYAQGSQLTGTEFPQCIVDAVKDLEKTIDYIEYERFASSLKEAQQRPEREAVEEDVLFAVPGVPKVVAAAMKRAKDYLEGSGPFDAKTAADLIRTSMDEAHRVVVSELERMTGRRCEREVKDGSRRAYMRDVDFITRPEEAFFSAIYTLLSDAATHRLLAPKETVLVMNITVENYLLLLFRRLDAQKTSLPQRG